jgi:DNA-binding IclR family transcriptional regulator
MGDMANLITYENGLAAHIYVAKGEEALETDIHTGVRLHSHSSASGKALLSQFPEEKVREIYEERGLPQHGPNTITDLDELLVELETIRETGIAFDRQERLEGLRCVAATMRREDPHPPAASSLSGPIGRMKGDRFEEQIPERLSNIADTIRIKLQYA